MLYAGVLAAIVALLCGNLTVSALTTDQNGLLLGVLIGMVFASNVPNVPNMPNVPNYL